MVAGGFEFTATVSVSVPVHPLALVTVTVYTPGDPVDNGFDVLPVFHKYDTYNPASSDALVPLQMDVCPDITGVGLGFTVNTNASVSGQPPALVTVTVYVFVVATDIVCVDAPFDHKYEAKPGPASSTELPPAHTAESPVMDALGDAIKVTNKLAVPVHPAALVTVTVYVPPVETLIEEVVAPEFHE